MQLSLRWTGIGIICFVSVALAGAQTNPTKPQVNAAPSDLTPKQKHMLLFMREEEKLARDVYNQAAKFHSMRIFTNIPRSEQRHMNAMLGLLNAYGLEDPAKDLEPGKFKDPEVQKLYDAWAARCEKSLTEALTVGVEIEKHDIADLETALKDTTADDIKLVYENLLAGSRRHLSAFQRHLPTNTTGAQNGQMRGAGRGQGLGRGKGNGQGKGRGLGRGQTGMGQGAGMGQDAACGVGRGPGAGRGNGAGCGPGAGRGCCGSGMGICSVGDGQSATALTEDAANAEDATSTTPTANQSSPQ